MSSTAVPGKKSTQRGRRQGSKGHNNTGKITTNIRISNKRIISQNIVTLNHMGSSIRDSLNRAAFFIHAGVLVSL
jgi:hypothetical protein